MIINTNTINLTDTGTTLDSSIIIVNSSRQTNKVNFATITVYINFYKDGEAYGKSQDNFLRVEGFDKKAKKFTFEYPLDDKDAALYFDQQIKAYIMTIFPDWDADKLVLTTEINE